MPYRVRPKVTIQKLTRELDAKLKIVRQLEEERNRLSYRQSLLEDTCYCFRLLVGKTGSASTSCSNEELVLLKQLEQLGSYCISPTSSISPLLTNSNSSIAGSTSDNSSSQNPAEPHPITAPTIAPADNPMQWMITILEAKDPSVCSQKGATAASILKKLRSDYQSTISQLAANVVLLSPHDNSTNYGSGSAALAAIQEAFNRHWSNFTSLLRSGQGNIALDFLTSDVMTGERIEQRNLPLYEQVAQELQLTTEQQQRIIASLEFFMQLQHPVMAQRQQAQLQLSRVSTAAVADTEQSLHAAQGAAAGDVFSRQRAILQQQELWREQDEQQHKMLLRMGKILHKEYTISFCAYVAIEGCLTWKQLAQFALALFPHPFSPIELAKKVAAQVAATATETE